MYTSLLKPFSFTHTFCLSSTYFQLIARWYCLCCCNSTASSDIDNLLELCQYVAWMKVKNDIWEKVRKDVAIKINKSSNTTHEQKKFNFICCTRSIRKSKIGEVECTVNVRASTHHLCKQLHNSCNICVDVWQIEITCEWKEILKKQDSKHRQRYSRDSGQVCEREIALLCWKKKIEMKRKQREKH